MYRLFVISSLSFFFLHCATIEIKNIAEAGNGAPVIAMTQEKTQWVTDEIRQISNSFAEFFFINKNKAIAAYGRLMSLIWQQQENSSKQTQQLALLEYLAGRFSFYMYSVFTNELEIRITWLEHAISHLQKSLQYQPGSGEVYAVLFTVYRHLMRVNGIMGTLLYRGKVKEYRNLMQQYNAGNAIVLEQIGLFYMDTAPVFGGDIDRAILAFQEALKSAPGYLAISAYLAICYRKKENIFAARSYLKQSAQEPDSFFKMAEFQVYGNGFQDLK